MNILKKLFSGRLDRKGFILRSLCIMLFLIIPYVAISLLTHDSAKGFLSTDVTFFITSFFSIAILVAAIPIFFLALAWQVRRTRDILSSRPNAEVYITIGLITIFNFIIPFFGLLISILLSVIPSDYSNSETYKNTFEAPIENLTNFIQSLVKKKNN